MLLVFIQTIQKFKSNFRNFLTRKMKWNLNTMTQDQLEEAKKVADDLNLYGELEIRKENREE